MDKRPLRQRSALIYVLIALIPYSKPNLLLAYRPSQFFWELEKISRYKKQTLQNAYYRGVQAGLISRQAKNPKLTELGKRRVVPFLASRLKKGASLMVIFDIPEDRARDRRILRGLLRHWHFKRVQKSVWVTEFDFRQALVELITELRLEGYVELHENARLFPK